LNSTGVKVIAKSAWAPPSDGLVKRRIVVWQAEANEFDQGQARYVTHMECQQSDDEPAYFHMGHYDLSMGAAILDFEERCNKEGILAVPVTDAD